MTTTQLMLRYPFFAGLRPDYLTLLSNVASECVVEPGQVFFHEGDDLDKFFLVLEGSVAITVGVTDRDQVQTKANQLTGNFNMRGVVVSTVPEGDIFGWSALVPPHSSSAGAKSITRCRLVAYDCVKLRPIFEEDCRFAYLMLLKAARIIRARLRDGRVESLAEYVV